jgi:hypothetical protein
MERALHLTARVRSTCADIDKVARQLSALPFSVVPNGCFRTGCPPTSWRHAAAGICPYCGAAGTEVCSLYLAEHRNRLRLLQKLELIERIVAKGSIPSQLSTTQLTTPSTMSATPQSSGGSSGTNDLLTIPSCGTNSSMETTPIRWHMFGTAKAGSAVRPSLIPIRISSPSALNNDSSVAGVQRTKKSVHTGIDTNELYRRKLAEKLKQSQDDEWRLPAQLFADTSPNSASNVAHLMESGADIPSDNLNAAWSASMEEVALLRSLEDAVLNSPRLAGRALNDPLPGFPTNRLLHVSPNFKEPATGRSQSAPPTPAPNKGKEPRVATPYPSSLSPRTKLAGHHGPVARASGEDMPVSKRALLGGADQVQHHRHRRRSGGKERSGIGASHTEPAFPPFCADASNVMAEPERPTAAAPTAAEPPSPPRDPTEEAFLLLQSPMMGTRRRGSRGRGKSKQSDGCGRAGPPESSYGTPTGSPHPATPSTGGSKDATSPNVFPPQPSHLPTPDFPYTPHTASERCNEQATDRDTPGRRLFGDDITAELTMSSTAASTPPARSPVTDSIYSLLLDESFGDTPHSASTAVELETESITPYTPCTPTAQGWHYAAVNDSTLASPTHQTLYQHQEVSGEGLEMLNITQCTAEEGMETIVGSVAPPPTPAFDFPDTVPVASSAWTAESEAGSAAAAAPTASRHGTHGSRSKAVSFAAQPEVMPSPATTMTPTTEQHLQGHVTVGGGVTLSTLTTTATTPVLVSRISPADSTVDSAAMEKVVTKRGYRDTPRPRSRSGSAASGASGGSIEPCNGAAVENSGGALQGELRFSDDEDDDNSDSGDDTSAGGGGAFKGCDYSMIGAIDTPGKPAQVSVSTRECSASDAEPSVGVGADSINDAIIGDLTSLFDESGFFYRVDEEDADVTGGEFEGAEVAGAVVDAVSPAALLAVAVLAVQVAVSLSRSRSTSSSDARDAQAHGAEYGALEGPAMPSATGGEEEEREGEQGGVSSGAYYSQLMQVVWQAEREAAEALGKLDEDPEEA